MHSQTNLIKHATLCGVLAYQSQAAQKGVALKLQITISSFNAKLLWRIHGHLLIK